MVLCLIVINIWWGVVLLSAFVLEGIACSNGNCSVFEWVMCFGKTSAMSPDGLWTQQGTSIIG